MQPVTSARRARLSPAVAIASLALIVALAGAAYAVLGNTASATAASSGSGITLDYTRANTAFTVKAGQVFGAYMTCPAGMFAIGGGDGTNAVPGENLLDVLPYDSVHQSYTSPANSWDVWVQNTTAKPQIVEPYAVCIGGVSVAQAKALGSHAVGGRPHFAP